MPAEARRFQHRLGTRDRRFLALLACAAAAGTSAAVLLGGHDARSTTAARCVTTTRAHVMGAATFRYCDEDAAVYCRSAAGTDERIAAQCEALGLPTRP